LPDPLVHASPELVRAVVPHVRRREGTTIEDLRAELEEASRAEPSTRDRTLGALCDAGLKRNHNEDAVAVATGETRGEKWSVLVVCDGVSSSTHADQASTIAAKTACDALAHFARSGDVAYEAATAAMSQAVRAAHLAICTSNIEHGAAEPPGTTIVAGFVYRRRLTIGWVGDSRAYWVTKTGAELLTRDHSWANEAVAKGEMTEEEAMHAPLGHALTKCLGPLEVGDVPHEIDVDVRARDLPSDGIVVLCSDGLWNYFAPAESVAALVRACGDAPAATIARVLVNHALARGGQDNVTVAVHAHAIRG
jgi:serine/threonine protein phosphatase PrpC